MLFITDINTPYGESRKEYFIIFAKILEMPYIIIVALQ